MLFLRCFITVGPKKIEPAFGRHFLKILSLSLGQGSCVSVVFNFQHVISTLKSNFCIWGDIFMKKKWFMKRAKCCRISLKSVVDCRIIGFVVDGDFCPYFVAECRKIEYLL